LKLIEEKSEIYEVQFTVLLTSLITGTVFHCHLILTGVSEPRTTLTEFFPRMIFIYYLGFGLRKVLGQISPAIGF
jgi:hypothetical protein